MISGNNKLSLVVIKLFINEKEQPSEKIFSKGCLFFMNIIIQFYPIYILIFLNKATINKTIKKTGYKIVARLF